MRQSLFNHGLLTPNSWTLITSTHVNSSSGAMDTPSSIARGSWKDHVHVFPLSSHSTPASCTPTPQAGTISLPASPIAEKPPSKLSRAHFNREPCESCVEAKVKCVFEPVPGPVRVCKRCTRQSQPCIPKVKVEKKAKGKSPRNHRRAKSTGAISGTIRSLSGVRPSTATHPPALEAAETPIVAGSSSLVAAPALAPDPSLSLPIEPFPFLAPAPYNLDAAAYLYSNMVDYAAFPFSPDQATYVQTPAMGVHASGFDPTTPVLVPGQSSISFDLLRFSNAMDYYDFTTQ